MVGLFIFIVMAIIVWVFCLYFSWQVLYREPGVPSGSELGRWLSILHRFGRNEVLSCRHDEECWFTIVCFALGGRVVTFRHGQNGCFRTGIDVGLYVIFI